MFINLNPVVFKVVWNTELVYIKLSFVVNDPVTVKLPVIKAEPVNGNTGKFILNVLPSPFVNIKLGLENDAVFNNEPVLTVVPPPIVIVKLLKLPTVVVTPDPVKLIRLTLVVSNVLPLYIFKGTNPGTVLKGGIYYIEPVGQRLGYLLINIQNFIN